MSFNFDYIGYFDVSEMKDKLASVEEGIWLENTIRQSTYDVHKHTETVELIWDIDSIYVDRKGKVHSNFYKFNIQALLDGLQPIYEAKYGKGEFIRVLLVKLKKQSMIEPHVDNTDSLETCKRTHIALITNPEVIFKVGGEEKYMQEGEIWEINNQNTHSVENNSDLDRIHFIMDFAIREPKNNKKTKSLV
jgi:hypothetical protein